MKDWCGCPICKSKAEHEVWSCGWCVEEEYLDCKVCGFFFHFAYGAYMEVVGNKYFIWDYTEERKQFLSELSEQNLWLAAAGKSIIKVQLQKIVQYERMFIYDDKRRSN